PAAVQLLHALLPDRIHARKDFLRGSDGLVADVPDEIVCGRPGFRTGFPDDDVQAYAKRQFSATPVGRGLDARDLLGDLGRRLAPGQIFVDRIDRDIDARIGRAAEIERRAWRLQRLKQQAAILDADVPAVKIHRLAGE